MLRSDMSNTGNEHQSIVNLSIRGMVNAGSHPTLLTLGNACMVRTGLAKESQTETSEKPFISLTKAMVPTSPSPFAPCGEGQKENQRGTQMSEQKWQTARSTPAGITPRNRRQHFERYGVIFCYLYDKLRNLDTMSRKQK